MNPLKHEKNRCQISKTITFNENVINFYVYANKKRIVP